MFLWHMAAAVLAAAALYVSELMPQPTIGSGEWLLLRLPWLAACAVVLAAAVAVFARVEFDTVWRSTTWLGLLCIVTGLLGIAGTDQSDEGLAMFPSWALATYLTGAGLLRLTRHRQRPAGR